MYVTERATTNGPHRAAVSAFGIDATDRSLHHRSVMPAD